VSNLFLFLARLAEIVGRVWKRKNDRDDLPETKIEKKRNVIHEEVANDDEDAANKRIADLRFRMRNKSAGDPVGPDGKKNES
jgi:hypothetical protein